MKITSILVICLLLIGCSTTKPSINLDNLSQVQIRNAGPGQGAPGKCYTKLIDQYGNSDWYQIFCENDKYAYFSALDALKKLDYINSDTTINSKEYKEALLSFQKKHGLAYGALDEATLYLLTKKST